MRVKWVMWRLRRVKGREYTPWLYGSVNHIPYIMFNRTIDILNSFLLHVLSCFVRRFVLKRSDTQNGCRNY